MKVLIFSNLYTPGRRCIFDALEGSQHHRYVPTGPGLFRANPYSRKKHIGLMDLVRRLGASLVLAGRSLRYDVLIVDSAFTAFFVSIFLWPLRRPRLMIANFNMPRRRTGFWRALGAVVYRRVSCFIVHSRLDIELGSRLYGISPSRFHFMRYAREAPSNGVPSASYSESDRFIMSYGGNARDYRTFFRAMEGTGLHAVVVAREYNLQGLRIPDNVQVYCNIPLDECDRLVRQCHFTVFTFDGSEPSCGQISVVTSLMLGKPTICTDCSAMRDYVTDEENGLFASMGDSEGLRARLLRLAHDEALYRKLSSGAFDWSQQHATADSYRAAMNQAVEIAGRL